MAADITIRSMKDTIEVTNKTDRIVWRALQRNGVLVVDVSPTAEGGVTTVI